jgi:hypothetical protein
VDHDGSAIATTGVARSVVSHVRSPG